MRIGLISDTHLTDPDSDLHPGVYRGFAGVDLILHLGDIYATFVLDRLEKLAPVLGIQAYPDPPDPRLLPIRVVPLGGLKVGMIHNLGAPETPMNVDVGLVIPSERPAREMLKRKFGEHLDVVVFGDTHEELVEEQQGILFVNPGSPTYPGIKHELGSPGTVAMLEIVDGKASAYVIQL